ARSNGRWQIRLLSHNGTVELNAGQLVLATGRNARDLLGRTTSIRSERLAFTATVGSSSDAPRYAFHLELTERGWWYGLPHPIRGTFLGYCRARESQGRGRSSLASMFSRELSRTRLMRDLVCSNPEPLIVHGCVAGIGGGLPACGEG